MGLRDEYDWDSLVNESERLVLTELETQLEQAVDQCKCQDCVLDMAAYALNNVRPTYRVSLLGSVYAKSAARADLLKEVRQAVQDAIRKVHANPSHD